jgi:Na+-driven multidrug efflux pump
MGALVCEEEEGSSVDKSDNDLKNMLKFAIPALGIYLCNPMLSNIDNAFVGRTTGTAGLAALSPATICTDQMLYLFSFLARATTGLVSRAYGVTKDSQQGDTKAAQQAASAPLTVALICGVALSILYAFATPSLLAALQVQPDIRPQAASYIYWRGAIAWAALAQSVSLSIMMATRDSTTPLKIIGLAAAFNIVGDYALCVWPFRLGCSGAAAATAGATLLSSAFMMRGLKRKGLLPQIRIPTRKELRGLMEFTGPLMAITLTRLLGFISMQRRAMSLGVQNLAAYQVAINMMVFFVLFGEPLSQLFQTKLPALIDIEDRESVASTFKSVLKLAACTSVGVALLSFVALYCGAPLFTADVAVQGLARQVAPALSASVLTTIFAIAMDGAMLASRDFGFILSVGIATFLAQITLLPRCHTIPAIFGTFTLRLGLYSVLAAARLATGSGALGRLLRRKPKTTAAVAPA